MQTITKIPARKFVIIRHTWHRCIYLLVVFIFAVVSLFLWCTITFFIKTSLLSLFLILFRWLWTFYNYMIFRSSSKKFARRAFRTSGVQITSCTWFFLFLSDPFETYLYRMVGTSTKSAICLDNICFHYFYHNLRFYKDLDIQYVDMK